jgi:hypothetical protein
MSNTITNEQAEQGLYLFWSVRPESNDYDDFWEFWSGIVMMSVHKQMGFIDNITSLGYEQIVSAYNELADLGYFDSDEDDSEIDE